MPYVRRYLPIISLAMLMLLSLYGPSSERALASSGLGSQINKLTEGLTENLTSQIGGIVSNAINNTTNDTNSVMQSSTVVSDNQSDLTSSQIVISRGGNGSAADGNQNPSISRQVTTVNGVCTSNVAGGFSNDTLSSQGLCNDQLTGGPGADRFVCGEGTDTVRDFSQDEKDVIVDRQNCETIL